MSLAVKIGTCERVTDLTGQRLQPAPAAICVNSPADGYHHLPTIAELNSTPQFSFRLSQYCLWLTSDLMAKPAPAPAQSRRNLKMESPLGPKLLFMDSKFIFSKSFLLPPSIYLILADLFLYLRRFSLFNSHDLLTSECP